MRIVHTGLALLVLAANALAQPHMIRVHTPGAVTSFPLADIDSITFSGVDQSGQNILFTRISGGSDRLFVSNESGTTITELPTGTGYVQNPRWSPDGSKIVYNRYVPPGSAPETTQVWIINADGSGRRLVLNNGFYPAWHNDGNQIMYTRSGADPSQEQIIRIVNLDGTNDRVLIDSPGDKDQMPVMNPVNSDKVVYYYDAGGWPYFAEVRLRTVSNGRDTVLIGADGLLPSHFFYSRSGQYILVRKWTTQDVSQLRRFDIPARTSTTLLTTAVGEGAAACFGPGDQKIYYYRTTSSSGGIYKMSIDGSGQQLLFSLPSRVAWVDVR